MDAASLSIFVPGAFEAWMFPAPLRGVAETWVVTRGLVGAGTYVGWAVASRDVSSYSSIRHILQGGIIVVVVVLVVFVC
jgi:hypothetical protein